MKKVLTFLISFFILVQSLLFTSPVIRNVNADEFSDAIDGVSSNLGCGTFHNACCTKPGKIDMKLPNFNLPVPANLVNGLASGIFNNSFRHLLNPVFNGANDLFLRNALGSEFLTDDKPFCTEGEAQTVTGKCLCVDTRAKGLNRLCFPIQSSSERNSCLRCVENAKGVWTGIGCLNSNFGDLIKEKLAGTFVGIGGGISLLCIMYAAFILQTSRGNPERIKKAKEMLRACITGLLLIIFSILILKVIGVDILRIPGFSS